MYALYGFPGILLVILIFYCILGKICCQIPFIPGKTKEHSSVIRSKKIYNDILSFDINRWEGMLSLESLMDG